MSDDHEIVEAESVEITRDERDEDVLHPMVRAMMSRPDFGPEEMGRMMELQERWEAGQAKKAYQAARSALLADLPAVVKKNKHVAFGTTRYSYTDLPQLMRVVMPALEQHGFSLEWRNEGDGRVESVTCILSHRLGHSESNTRRCAVEPKKGMSAVQSAQATVTYLQRHTLAAILGVTTDDAPDADASTVAPTSIDVHRNLRAVSRLQHRGIAITDAEEYIGRQSPEWTSADLDRLSQWIRGRESEQETAGEEDGR